MSLNEIYWALDPIAFQLGPFVVRWYGLGYLAGFVLAGVVIYRLARRWGLDITVDDVVTHMTGVSFGIIIGARIGYVIFYGQGYYLQHPLSILMLNEGGMSFHGGLVGAVVGGWLACRTTGLDFRSMADMTICGAPLGIFLVRCANFVNGELWGKPCDLPWAVIFSVGDVPRHPSQLYEALLEGAVMFLVLWALSRRVPARPQGTFLGTFLLLYGIFRFAIEFVRLPDAQLGYLAFGWLTMGQLLSVPLVVIGALELVLAYRRQWEQVGHVD
ncbi:MAG: prolipoprotein diacylglyceryl transferase [Atopobiaceae bacterium]|nr:prolipoprotein diacylglyceryl transferase [Atopobiaceae bacterium]MBQ6649935.1 prolipoprotein diacylglyceryl transferase [Atopobiaceae bacterium]